ncbi:MAG: histidine kinase N-terminal domain-containing protein [Acidimicrobiales bacterium]
MATLAELARQHTPLDRADIGHLQRLVGSWGMLADFSFSDLLLYARTNDERWVIVGQVRPVTSQTLYRADWVGQLANDSERAVLVQAWEQGDVVEGVIEVESLNEQAIMRAIPVRREGRLIAICTREWSPTHGRQPGELERTYFDIFDRFARMIVEGAFPFPDERRDSDSAPRVGDGVVVLDAAGRVTYNSPNAVSALHRVGINTTAVGLRLSELGFDDGAIRSAFDTREPVTEEVDQTTEVTMLVRCIPILASGAVSGAVLLLRDVTEVRRRDRMLLTKDATIREIHHRVKNNLQTISSLLRLQGRRLASREAKAAIEESVRRIRTIALVHETLSRDAGDDVAFVDIVRPLARMAEDSLQSPDRPVSFKVIGEGGKLPSTVATPLAVVLTELLQNAVDHAFRNGQPGSVITEMDADGDHLTVRVTDDGVGLPEGFSLESATGLGLSIVRTLVTTELAGTIEMRAAPGGKGTVVELRVPVDPDQR